VPLAEEGMGALVEVVVAVVEGYVVEEGAVAA
jgi:hypothetical protein